MDSDHQIVSMVYEAKENRNAADAFIGRYMGFIKSETAKFIHRIPQEGVDDELSIAMMAFYEAISGYDRSRGNFLSYAARNIHNRLIDFYRKEKRHSSNLSYHQLVSDDDNSHELVDEFADPRNVVDESTVRKVAASEIQEFGRQLALFSLTLSDVAENCPKQKRTLHGCHKALDYARQNPSLLNEFLLKRKVPVTELANGSGISKKTLERHRKYLAAILLALTNGYEIIRGHLYQIIPRKGGEPL